MPIFLRALATSGRDVSAFADRFSLPSDALRSDEIVVPLPKLIEALEAIALEARDPYFGLHVAARAPRGMWGLAEYVSMTSPTLRDAVTKLLGHSTKVIDLRRFEITEARGVVVFEHRLTERTGGLGAQGNEFALAIAARLARDYTGQRVAAKRVWFAHRRDGPTEELERFFETRDIAFGRNTNGVAVRAAVLDLPLVTADPNLQRLLEGQAQALGSGSSSNLVDLVRDKLLVALQDGAPNVGRVARMLHMSRRSLQRRLNEQGASFRVVVDNVRCSLAKAYLSDARLSLAEVGFLLGYSRQSTFVRTFRRWTGATPSEFRLRST